MAVPSDYQGAQKHGIMGIRTVANVAIAIENKTAMHASGKCQLYPDSKNKSLASDR